MQSRVIFKTFPKKSANEMGTFLGGEMPETVEITNMFNIHLKLSHT